MRCDEFESRLNHLLDQRQPPKGDVRLLSHADRCPACRRQLDAWDVLETGLHAEQRPEPPADLVRQVLADQDLADQDLAELSSASPATSARYRAWAAAALAMAALLLVSLSLVFPPEPASMARPEEDDAKVTEESAPDVAPQREFLQPQVAVEPVPSESSPEATAEMNLPSEFGDGTDSYSYWYNRLSLESTQSPYLHQSTWVGPMTATMRPLASTLTTAFNAVRSTLPGSKSSSGEPPQAGLLDARSDLGLS